MQTDVPGAVDQGAKTAETRSFYGFDREQTETGGGRSLTARRPVERGVRFVRVFSGGRDDHDCSGRGCGARSAGVSESPAGLIHDLHVTVSHLPGSDDGRLTTFPAGRHRQFGQFGQFAQIGQFGGRVIPELPARPDRGGMIDGGPVSRGRSEGDVPDLNRRPPGPQPGRPASFDAAGIAFNGVGRVAVAPMVAPDPAEPAHGADLAATALHGEPAPSRAAAVPGVVVLDRTVRIVPHARIGPPAAEVPADPLAALPTDVRRVVAAWPTLPPAIRAGVLAMIEAAKADAPAD